MRFDCGALGIIQGSTARWSASGHPAEIQICGDRGSVFMNDDRTAGDDEIREVYKIDASSAGAGAADPSAIDFSGHQRNFEDAIAAFREGRAPSVDGRESR